MTKSEFHVYLSENVKDILFETNDKIHDMFDPFIEDGTLEGYEYEFDFEGHLKISFDFNDYDPIIINIGRTE